LHLTLFEQSQHREAALRAFCIERDLGVVPFVITHNTTGEAITTTGKSRRIELTSRKVRGIVSCCCFNAFLLLARFALPVLLSPETLRTVRLSIEWCFIICTSELQKNQRLRRDCTVRATGDHLLQFLVSPRSTRPSMS
jgi:hypothetical protein